MARKIFCNNISCKHHCASDSCESPKIILNYGKCESFEKGFSYYFHLVWDALSNSNFINADNLTDDLRIGIYYVMSVYNLKFKIYEHGLWRMLLLVDEDGRNGLKYEEIVARQMDQSVFNKLYNEFLEGKLPNTNTKQPKKETQPFGWLSPTGVFTEGDWGEHEEVAQKIVEEKSMTDEFLDWKPENFSIYTYRDFLSHVKGYCLIHSPSSVGYIVSNVKELTKAQKEFLYGYFMDLGDTFKAEQFVCE